MIAPLFYIFAGLAIVAALSVVLQRTPVYSALSLILVLCSLAVIYLLLGAQFLAVIQVIVYAGAIMVLFVFVIMLLNARQESPTDHSLFARRLGLPLLAVFLAEVIFVVVGHFSGSVFAAGATFDGGPRAVGALLFRNYVLPFEVTSILILVAVMGAVVLAKKQL
jgi:NADH-quinone oxidoreductase subunit J